MAWLFLALAALFEIAFAMSMKASEGFTRTWPSILTVSAWLAESASSRWQRISLQGVAHIPVEVAYTDVG